MSTHPSATAAPDKARRSQTIITVASGKGGVGKTMVSTTLAHSLAFAGERTLLVDCDLGLANVDVQLGITPEHDLASVVAGTTAFEDATIRVSSDSTTSARGAFDVIAGSSGSGNLGALARTELARLRQGLTLIAAHYDRVIVDLAAGVDPAVTMFASIEGPTLVVVTDEPTSITDAYAFIKVASMTPRDDGTAADIRIVVNMAETVEAGRKTYEALSRACGNFLGITPPLAGIVPRDTAVRDAVRHQTPLLTRSPNAKAGAAIASMADGIRAGSAK